MIWFLVIFGSFFVAYLAAWPFFVERRKKAIGPTERHGAEGDFAPLSQGVTYYRWVGPTRGPVAIVIHGWATPMVSMDAVAKGLGDIGYRVLMYDLYGRGLSDAPKGVQDRAYFLRQLSDLLTFLGLREDITLAGYSMGGAIATAFAAENPHCIKQIMIFASSGIITKESRFGRFCRRIPLLGDWTHAMFMGRRVLKAIPLRGRTDEIQKVYDVQRNEMNRRGYLPALLSSRRGILSEVQEKEHRQLGRKGIPVTAIWAENDEIIPLSAIGRLAEWNRSAHHGVVENADHAAPYTHGRQLAEALRSALHD